MNAAAKPRKIQLDAFVPPSIIENVPAWRPYTITAPSISSEPTIV